MVHKHLYLVLCFCISHKKDMSDAIILQNFYFLRYFSTCSYEILMNTSLSVKSMLSLWCIDYNWIKFLFDRLSGTLQLDQSF